MLCRILIRVSVSRNDFPLANDLRTLCFEKLHLNHNASRQQVIISLAENEFTDPKRNIGWQQERVIQNYSNAPWSVGLEQSPAVVMTNTGDSPATVL